MFDYSNQKFGCDYYFQYGFTSPLKQFAVAYRLEFLEAKYSDLYCQVSVRQLGVADILKFG